MPFDHHEGSFHYFQGGLSYFQFLIPKAVCTERQFYSGQSSQDKFSSISTDGIFPEQKAARWDTKAEIGRFKDNDILVVQVFRGSELVV